MTRRSCALAVLAVFALVAVAAAQDLNGDWTLTINSPQGIIDTDATFQVEGDKVTGVFSGPTGDADVAGTMEGTTLKLAFTVTTGQGVIDVTMTAEVAGDEMKGMLDFGMGTADFTGKKK